MVKDGNFEGFARHYTWHGNLLLATFCKIFTISKISYNVKNMTLYTMSKIMCNF